MLTIRTIDGVSSAYQTANHLPLYKDRPVLVDQSRKSYIYTTDMPSSASQTSSSSAADSDMPDKRDTPLSSPGLAVIEKSECEHMRPLSRGAPGDAAIFAKKTPEQKESSKRSSQYYSHVFEYRKSDGTARERVLAECMIHVNINTNVIVGDEYSLITNLSKYFAGRYQRTEKSIIITLTHSACLFFAGSFDPAYIITITTVPSLMLPATNVRNAYVIQEYLQKELKVDQERGQVKFIPIPEENLAVKGVTVKGEIDQLERKTTKETESLERNELRSGNRATTKANRRFSTRSMRNLKTGSYLTTVGEQEPSSPTSHPTMPSVPLVSEADLRAEKIKKIGRRKSFMASVFGKGS